MAHHMVDRGADRLGVAVVADVGGDAAQRIHDVVVAQLVQRVGADAGTHMRHQHVQHFGGKLAGAARLGNIGNGVDGGGQGALHCAAPGVGWGLALAGCATGSENDAGEACWISSWQMSE
ncbi:hypothetical protein D3C71_1894000 [compost metagenome]